MAKGGCMIKGQHIIERARLVQFAPKDPATFALLIDGKTFYLDAPEAAPYVERLAQYLNDQMKEDRDQALYASIPVTCVIEDY
jgi:hypothetical protein